MVLVLREIMMSAVGVRVVVRRYTLQVAVGLLTLNDLVFVSCILLIDRTKIIRFIEPRSGVQYNLYLPEYLAEPYVNSFRLNCSTHNNFFR